MSSNRVEHEGSGRVHRSVSTWQPPTPPPPSAARAAVLDEITERILDLADRRVRVAIDGRTAAGKSSLGHELAQRVAAAGRDVLLASLDDFKRPWRDAHLYDRTSPVGYYRNAFDYDAVRRLLLEPAIPSGSGRVALCSIDPLTQIDHSHQVVEMALDGVLLVDGVFALRPEIDDLWDLRIWIEVDAELALQRGALRDVAIEGGLDQARELHRDRYLASEAIYIDEIDPRTRADIVMDNTSFPAPRLLGG